MLLGIVGFGFFIGHMVEGIIERDEYEAVRDEIMARLWELRDPETGEQVVQEVYRREEIYSGKHIAKAADILFIPTRMEYFGFGEYEFGSNEIIESMKRGISGTHRPNGMFLMYGQPIKANGWLEGAQIFDLAPTILHLMGEAVLSDMDGQVLNDALKEEWASFVPRVEKAESMEADTASSEGGLSKDQIKQIGDRLRDLGYVG